MAKQESNRISAPDPTPTHDTRAAEDNASPARSHSPLIRLLGVGGTYAPSRREAAASAATRGQASKGDAWRRPAMTSQRSTVRETCPLHMADIPDIRQKRISDSFWQLSVSTRWHFSRYLYLPDSSQPTIWFTPDGIFAVGSKPYLRLIVIHVLYGRARESLGLLVFLM
jgi:hypothetical protein